MPHDSFEALLPADMARKAENLGVAKATKAPLSAFILAITAGVFIGIAFVFYTVVTTGNDGIGWGLNRLIGGIAFSLGLMLVVVNGGELFTSSVLTVVARASRKISWSQLARNWALVYAGNFVGALGLVLIMQMARHYTLGQGQVGLSYMTIAQHKLHHTFPQAVALGIMCNVMVCLGVWMTFSARSVTDKLLAVILPVAMFVAAGFEHCIANMFQIPMAILTLHAADTAFWAETGRTAAEFSDLTWANFLRDNLLPVTIGNTIGGGLLVGLLYWFIYLRPASEPAPAAARPGVRATEREV